MIKASKQQSIYALVLDVLGLENIKMLSISLEKGELSFKTQLPIHNNTLRDSSNHNRASHIQKHQISIKNIKCLEDCNFYQSLDLNDYDFIKRARRAQEEWERSSKFLYEETLERNSCIASQIKQYQMEYNRYRENKLTKTRRKMKNMKMFTEGNTYDEGIKQYTEK